MKARYIRVSTSNQKVERQLALQYPDEHLFIDVVSGSFPFCERMQGKLLLAQLNSFNYVSVASIDRLGRNLLDILNTLQLLNEKGITLKVDNLGIESLINGKSNMAFKLIISVMANIAEMEREAMLEDQKQGIAIAKANGVYKGRIKGSIESTSQFLSKYPKVIKYLEKKHSLRDTAKLCDVSLGTVQRVSKALAI